MIVFVTGGTGLLGSHLLYSLSCQDVQILALRRKHSNLENVRKVFSYYTSEVENHFSKINWIEGDLLDEEIIINATKGVDIIFHLAAVVSYSVRKDKKETMFKVNVQSTKIIIDACNRNGIGKLCYVSSTSTLGSRDPKSLITENSALKVSKTTTNYALTKSISENLIMEASQKGLKTIIINPSIILGPGDWKRSSSKLILNIFNGLKFYPRGTIGFVDVRDVVTVIQKLLEKNSFGEKFIVSSENVSYKNVFNYISEGLGINTKFIPATNFLLGVKWRMEFVKTIVFGKEPLITKETVSFSRNEVFFCNSKIVNELNFTFKPVSEAIKYCTDKFKSDHF